MAILNNPPMDDDFRGQIDKKVVIKKWMDKIIITAYPDMSKVKYNDNQQAEQKRFADAVAYAQTIINDPQKKAQYKARLPKGKRVFNAAIAEFMKGK